MRESNLYILQFIIHLWFVFISKDLLVNHFISSAGHWCGFGKEAGNTLFRHNAILWRYPPNHIPTVPLWTWTLFFWTLQGTFHPHTSLNTRKESGGVSPFQTLPSFRCIWYTFPGVLHHWLFPSSASVWRDSPMPLLVFNNVHLLQSLSKSQWFFLDPIGYMWWSNVAFQQSNEDYGGYFSVLLPPHKRVLWLAL